ncbi:hypothetical protein F5888DRAFT_228147 [Russula emetica]|nr:hypothetical protein F5888DRAFT_228147 [Russula emetica]
MMGSFVALIVQFFFVYRIWVLSEKRWWWLCVIICLLSIFGAYEAFAAGVLSYLFGAFIKGAALQYLEMTWLITNTRSDLLIAFAMLYHLRRIWAKDGHLSNHVLVSIVRLIVETNLATTTVSFASLLMVLLYPEKNWYVCPTFVLGKLYSNTLLVSFNNRISIRDTYSARGGVIDLQAKDLHGPTGSRNRSEQSGCARTDRSDAYCSTSGILSSLRTLSTLQNSIFHWKNQGSTSQMIRFPHLP